MKQARQKLAEARAKRHWTLEKAAEELGVSVNTVNAWEHGRATPYPYNVDRICTIYGLSPEDLELTTTSLVVPQEAVGKHLETFIRQDLTLRLYALASQPYRSYQDIHAAMARILKDYESMSTNHRMNRRKALLRLVTLPFATPVLAAALTGEETPSSTLSQDLLAQCAVSIGACWELTKSADHNDLIMAFEGVSAYLPVLQRIVKAYSRYRQEAASLVAQGLLLKSVLAVHFEGTREALQYAQQALFYSKRAQDIALHLKSLERLAVCYGYSKHHKQSLETITQAEPLLEEIAQKELPVSPAVLALANGMLACAFARNGKDAKAHLDQAAALLPEENAQRPVYIHYNKFGFLLDAGIVYSQRGESEKAIKVFSQAVDPDSFDLKLPWTETGRIEVINYMTKASLMDNDKDIERTIFFWKGAITSAKAIQSEQCFNEAVSTYDIMQVVWPGDKRIMELRDLTEHW